MSIFLYLSVTWDVYTAIPSNETLDHSRIDTLYLIGDIIDMWAMSRQICWPDSHNKLLHRFMQMPSAGTRVIYLPGNHDEPAQRYDGMALGAIEIHREDIHTLANGKKLLLMHGDQFDQEVCFGPLHAWIGDKTYRSLMFVNRWYNRLQLIFWTAVKQSTDSDLNPQGATVHRLRDLGARAA